MILDWHLNTQEPADWVRRWLPPIQAYTRADSADPLWYQLQHTAERYTPYDGSRGFAFSEDQYLCFRGLDPLAPVAYAYHLGERIFVYPANFVVILQLNGDYTVARVS